MIDLIFDYASDENCTVLSSIYGIAGRFKASPQERWLKKSALCLHSGSV